MAHRTHHKIASYPQDVIARVNEMLVAGDVYTEIASYLAKVGHPTGSSSVGRYAQNFLKSLEKIKIVTEQSKAILETTLGTGLQVEEAAVQIALSKIMEFLIDMPDIKKEEASKVFTALARLQSSGVQREKLKIVWKEKIREAADEIETTVKKKGLTDEAADAIKKKILGIAA